MDMDPDLRGLNRDDKGQLVGGLWSRWLGEIGGVNQEEAPQNSGTPTDWR